jgi:ariadne-1
VRVTAAATAAAAAALAAARPPRRPLLPPQLTRPPARPADTYESDEDVEDAVEAEPEKHTVGCSDAVRVIGLDELSSAQLAVVRDVMSILDVPEMAVSVLMRAFHWNRERLLDAFYADRDGVLKDSGVYHLCSAAAAGGAAAGAAAGEEEELHCEICYEDVTAANSFCLGCTHCFCRDCWKGYLANAVSEGPNCVLTRCPAQGCEEVVTEDVFGRILADCEADGAAAPDGGAGGGDDGKGAAGMLDKYRKYLVHSFVNFNKSMRWCPSPHCTSAVTAPPHTRAVACSCGAEFCFKCGDEPHAPVSCTLLEKWVDKCQNESETANWILSHTKKCPKCSVRIEKNQGCNHITCKGAGCKYEFCWICLGPWEDHGTSTGGYYKCNRFESTDGAADGDAGLSEADKAKRELDKYLHYFKRYQNHTQAQKFAGDQRCKIESRMEQMQEGGGGTSWIDAQFLKTANEQLISCRRVLKYSYVFGYYLEAGGEKNLFEHLQEMLEKHTEHLSEHCENPKDRSDVINYTRVTERFMKQLLQGIEDGLTEQHKQGGAHLEDGGAAGGAVPMVEEGGSAAAAAAS